MCKKCSAVSGDDGEVIIVESLSEVYIIWVIRPCHFEALL